MAPTNRPRVYAHTLQDIAIIADGETATGWAGSTDVGNLGTSTEHRRGEKSLTFDKSGTSEAFGQVTLTRKAKDYIDFYDGKAGFRINLGAITDLASVTLIIGTDASNNYEYTIADTQFAAGWNTVEVSIDNPTVTNGVGANWSAITHIAVKVTLDAAGDTLADILLDAIQLFHENDINLGNIQGTNGGTLPAESIQVGAEITDPTNLAGKTEGQFWAMILDLQRALVTHEHTITPGGDTANRTQRVIEDFLGNSDHALQDDLSAALEASSLASDLPARAYEFDGAVDSAAATAIYFILILDHSAVPSDGAVTIKDFIIVNHTNGIPTIFSKTWKGGLPGALGLVWVMSSTQFTKTITSGANLASGLFRFKA